MTIVVSISQFRKNIADYLEKVKAGNTVVLQDEKKGQEIVQVTQKKSFDAQAFGIALQNAAGVFTENNHPEWKTKATITKWLSKVRRDADRTF